MEPALAAAALRRALPGLVHPITVADASVASGLALRDAEAGLNWLTSEYRGHLRVTEDGDLVRVFPHGFTKPWQTEEALARAARRAGRALLGAARLLVRAWLLVVMVSYALVFLALILGATVARQGGSSDRDDSPAVGLAGALFRMIADALFWTFHPFSPLYVGRGAGPAGARTERRRGDAFYEKVNRYVFGPRAAKEDPGEARARLLREIRARRGRIALGDVMRVTGLPRDQADPMMARLMLDYDGSVDVGDAGGVVYRFEALRRSAMEGPTLRERPAWERLPALPPLTGNSAGVNLLVTALNGFNLLASAWAIHNHLTLSNLALLFGPERPPSLPDAGVPIVLGVVPLVFSTLLFVLPVLRALYRGRQERRAADERARLGVLREAVTGAAKREPVPDERLRAVVRVATGEEPTSKDITRRVVALGGDVETGPDGEVRYRFADLEADEAAAAEERAHAPEEEARIGRVVFASDR